MPDRSIAAVPIRPPAQAEARGVLWSASFVSTQHPAASRKRRTFSDPFFAAKCRDVSPPRLSAAANRNAPERAYKTVVFWEGESSGGRGRGREIYIGTGERRERAVNSLART